MSEQPQEPNYEYPRAFRRFVLASACLLGACGLALLVETVMYGVRRDWAKGLTLAALITSAFMVAVLLISYTVTAVWDHQLTGKWPWTAWTLRSAIRSWLVSVGLAGPERFGSKPRHKVELAILVLLAGLIGLMVFAAARNW